MRTRRIRLAVLAVFLGLPMWLGRPDVVAAIELLNGVVIAPLSEIARDGPPKLENVTQTGAKVTFHSKIPLATMVVFGETRDYGKLAKSVSTDTLTSRKHVAELTGLEPNTLYYYRVQGIAADGTIYVGRSMAFRTLRKETDLTGLVPVPMQVVAVSSNYGRAANNDPWGADSAVDGDETTAWASHGDGDAAFLEVDLGALKQIDAVDVRSREMADGSARIIRFRIVTETGQEFGPFTLPDARKAYRFPIGVKARRLRFEALESTGGNTGLVTFSALTKKES